MRKLRIFAILGLVFAINVTAQDDDNTVEGSEVSGDLLGEDAALAEDIFGLDGGDFVSETQPATDEPATPPTEVGTTILTGKYTIQVFATYSMGKAGEIVEKVKAKSPGTEAFVAKEGGTYKVRVGSYANRGDADRQRDKLRTLGFNDAWVVTLE